MIERESEREYHHNRCCSNEEIAFPQLDYYGTCETHFLWHGGAWFPIPFLYTLISMPIHTPTIHAHHLESRVRVHFLTYTAILTAVHGNKTAVHGNKTAVHGNKTAVHGNKTAVHGNKTAVHGNKTAVHGIVYALTDCPSRPPYQKDTPMSGSKHSTIPDPGFVRHRTPG